MDLRLLALAVHLVGFALWIGGLAALGATSAAAAKGPAEARRGVATALAKGGAREADVGAGLAIVGGLWLLSFAPAMYLHQPWMHAKLTCVVALLGFHGFARARLGRASRGGEAGFPAWAFPAALTIAAVVVALVVFKPGQR